jgi:hypothetical protein
MHVCTHAHKQISAQTDQGKSLGKTEFYSLARIVPTITGANYQLILKQNLKQF